MEDKVELSGKFHAPAAFTSERQRKGTDFIGLVWKFSKGEILFLLLIEPRPLFQLRGTFKF